MRWLLLLGLRILELFAELLEELVSNVGEAEEQGCELLDRSPRVDDPRLALILVDVWRACQSTQTHRHLITQHRAIAVA